MLSRPTGLPTHFHELHSAVSKLLPTRTQFLERFRQITPYTVVRYSCPPAFSSTVSGLLWAGPRLTLSLIPQLLTCHRNSVSAGWVGEWMDG